MRQLRVVIASIRLRASRRYHARVVRHYWSNTDATHADMSHESFEFYAGQVAQLLGSPAPSGTVLDHGAGDGRIGMRLAEMGYDMQFSEFAPQFVQRINAAGYRCYVSDAVPADSFDTIFVNNAIFYVHPAMLATEIRWLLSRLRAGGRLLLLDVPTIQREHRLPGNVFVRAVRHLTHVCQPQAGGFFVDELRLAREFPGTRITPSWADYRAHLELRR